MWITNLSAACAASGRVADGSASKLGDELPQSVIVADQRGINVDRGVADADVSYPVLLITMLLAFLGVELGQSLQHLLDDTILGRPTRLVPLTDVPDGRRRGVQPRVDLLEDTQQLRCPRRILRGPKLVQLNMGRGEAQAAKGIKRDLPIRKPIEYVGVEYVGGHRPLAFFIATLASLSDDRACGERAGRCQPADGCLTDIIGPGQVGLDLTSSNALQYFPALMRRQLVRPAKANATSLCADATVIGSFLDQFTFELSDATKDRDQQ